VTFGQFGLKALECGWVTKPPDRSGSYRDERHMSAVARCDQRVPAQAITRKAAETRMGGGKGSPESWVAVVKPGKIMFELAGVSERWRARRCALPRTSWPSSANS